ncbi:hypothetical protein [Neodiprion abietis nucleopolyhedrovirus]|uniref:Uncharacterized protein n=1 Tax=Neodiprion abietis nucleopolyhedrovirus TaxID=204507 RepID=Q0ZP55_9CBAC|nr:hypothetical protein [Neodiprion abietis nucleopolyhedrovirus]ABC74899.1 unknown [Neodiprion abietis nucleopolyhedrovirus]
MPEIIDRNTIVHCLPSLQNKLCIVMEKMSGVDLVLNVTQNKLCFTKPETFYSPIPNNYKLFIDVLKKRNYSTIMKQNFPQAHLMRFFGILNDDIFKIYHCVYHTLKTNGNVETIHCDWWAIRDIVRLFSIPVS